MRNFCICFCDQEWAWYEMLKWQVQRETTIWSFPKAMAWTALILFYFSLWLFQKTWATFSTNWIQPLKQLWLLLWFRFHNTSLKTLPLLFFLVVRREGEHRINLVASNPLNNPEETSIIVYVTKLPACYPPAVTLLGLNSGKVGYNIEILDKPC